jgi:hypothetical protein
LAPIRAVVMSIYLPSRLYLPTSQHPLSGFWQPRWNGCDRIQPVTSSVSFRVIGWVNGFLIIK